MQKYASPEKPSLSSEPVNTAAASSSVASEEAATSSSPLAPSYNCYSVRVKYKMEATPPPAARIIKKNESYWFGRGASQVPTISIAEPVDLPPRCDGYMSEVASSKVAKKVTQMSKTAAVSAGVAASSPSPIPDEVVWARAHCSREPHVIDSTKSHKKTKKKSKMAKKERNIRKRNQKKSGQISILLPNLFLGNRTAASNLELLSSRGVTAVANIGGGKAKHASSFDSYLRISVADKEGVPLFPHFAPVADFIHKAIRKGGAVFVHCRSGIHRSPAMIMAYLMRHRGLSLAQAQEVVSLGRPIVHCTSHHLDELRKFEEACAQSVSTKE